MSSVLSCYLQANSHVSLHLLQSRSQSGHFHIYLAISCLSCHQIFYIPDTCTISLNGISTYFSCIIPVFLEPSQAASLPGSLFHVPIWDHWASILLFLKLYQGFSIFFVCLDSIFFESLGSKK